MPDFNAIQATVVAMQGKLNELNRVVNTARTGKATVHVIGDMPFSPAQKQALVDEYNSIKASLQTLFSSLP